MSNVRVRIAPSPTGFMHIGTLRTALYDYLLAKQSGGQFILRIEDTDQTRYVPGAVESLIQTFEWLSLDYDEGPMLGKKEKRKMKNGEMEIVEKGDCGPYTQSKRLHIYKKYADELLKKGHVYYCFCTTERLESLRQGQIAAKKPSMYDGLCKALPKEDSARRIKSGEKHVIRLNVPREGETEVNDLVHGKIIFKNALIDDQVLMKSDGFPTYHLAVVVDDHHMQITHVVRGEEWLPSTPKHLLLYKAFSWFPPQFVHLPLILNPNKTKLSKRQGDVAVEDYRKKGYLPEALINFVALLGWNPGTEKEIYSLEELVNDFKLENLNKSGAVFSIDKLDWLNGYYISKKTLRELTDLATPYLVAAGLLTVSRGKFTITATGEGIAREKLEAITLLEQGRMKKLEDIVYGTQFFFVDVPTYAPELLIWKKSDREKTICCLSELGEFLKTFSDKDFVVENLERKVRDWIHEKDFDVGSMLWPFRVALSGRQASPPPFDIATILGKKQTLKRIQYALSKLSE